MQQIEIRNYHPSDEPALIAMTPDVNSFKVLMALPRQRLIVAYCEQAAAGYACSCGGSAAFAYIYVSPVYRGSPAGAALYDFMEQQCREKGARRMLACLRKEDINGIESDAVVEFVRMEYTGRPLPLAPAVCENMKCYHQSNFPSCDFEQIIKNREYFDLSGHRRKVEKAKGAQIVAWRQGTTIAGCGRFIRNTVDLLAVAQKETGRGIGRALLIYMTNLILQRGYPNVCLWCERTHQRAMELYESIGFHPCYSECWPVKNFS